MYLTGFGIRKALSMRSHNASRYKCHTCHFKRRQFQIRQFLETESEAQLLIGFVDVVLDHQTKYE